MDLMHQIPYGDGFVPYGKQVMKWQSTDSNGVHKFGPFFSGGTGPFGTGPFGTAPAFGARPAPAFGAGPAPAPTFGGGIGGPTPAFGAVPAPTFGAVPTPAFGAAPAPTFGRSVDGIYYVAIPTNDEYSNYSFEELRLQHQKDGN
eukprot:c13954_g1_i1.p1 GENE.c13954_g1_i1~~c13954_g1_i1.p1  ORF type:complete len:152 (+),score=59.80 c13954_g1_i1:22-456(+)